MGSHSYLQNMQYCSGSACNQMRYQLIEMPTNIGHLQTAGLLNSHASTLTTTNVGHLYGDRSSVISLSELNWFTDALAKAKAAAAAEAAKVKKAAGNAINAGKEEAAKLSKAAKEAIAADVVKAKAAAKQFVAMGKAEALQIIASAGAAAKAEGVKLANQLISDAEAQGHVLDQEAKDKILALSIAVGQQASDKIGAADAKVNDILDGHRNAFTSGIIDFVEAKGGDLTAKGQAEAVALAAILDAKANDKVDQADAKIDSILDGHRPHVMLLI